MNKPYLVMTASLIKNKKRQTWTASTNTDRKRDVETWFDERDQAKNWVFVCLFRAENKKRIKEDMERRELGEYDAFSLDEKHRGEIYD